MKALIFLAGIGSRLKSVTDDPKCLIKIGGKPIIIHHLDVLEDVGIKELVLVVGYKQEKIRELLGDSYKNIKIKYIENKDYLKGSILSLLYAKDEFNDDVITMDGDVIFSKKILQTLMNPKNKNCFLVDFNFPDLGDEMKIVTNQQGVVRDVNYKIEKQEGDVIGEEVGFIKWSKEDAPIFRKVFEDLLNQGVDDDVYEKAVRYLINNNLCRFGVASTGNTPWIEIDFPEDLEKAKQFLSKNGN